MKTGHWTISVHQSRADVQGPTPRGRLSFCPSTTSKQCAAQSTQYLSLVICETADVSSVLFSDL